MRTMQTNKAENAENCGRRGKMQRQIQKDTDPKVSGIKQVRVAIQQPNKMVLQRNTKKMLQQGGKTKSNLE